MLPDSRAVGGRSVESCAVEILIIGLMALLVIVACNELAPRVGLASPLILLGLGIAIGFLPMVQAIAVSPEIILEVVLPPLLFGAAVSMPVMDFRRELVSVALLAVGLVALSAVVLGVVVHALIPAIPMPWAIALGAVLSPTDAVAVAIARGSGVSHRIITILEGEGLFNDATALVLLSSATAAGLMTDASALEPVSLGADFLLALAVAVVVGLVVGQLCVHASARIGDPTAHTVFSFTIPFLASLPAEHLGGSGLVAAVVAGLVASLRGPVLVPPANRRAAQQNWRTLMLVLEGGIFLVMGLQAFGIVSEVQHVAPGGLAQAAVIAALAGALTVVLRALFVAPLLAWLRLTRRRRRRRLEQRDEHMRLFEERLTQACQVDDEVLAARNLSRREWERSLGRWHRRLESGRRRQRRGWGDMAYFVADTLGPREGAVIVWAGMRGAVTLAAAQTLPLSTPLRPFLLLVALLVAAGSLIIQGLTLPLLIRLVKPQMAQESQDAQERERLISLLGGAVKETALAQALSEHAQQDPGSSGGPGSLTRSFSTVGRTWAWINAEAEAGAGHGRATDGDGGIGSEGSGVDTAAQAVGGPGQRETTTAPLAPAQVRDLAIEAIHAQREALLEARDEGMFSSTTLSHLLDHLDAEEIMLSTRRLAR